MASSLSSQRFCLRWNNHQSNLLSVFDQLLHDESFVDVTLAVEGRFLRAHKMVLSACSPYFQALFIGHPDKHPIVILKDVPYSDMRSLLDFMYRGEVSVDQDRLTAFLKVAESLRIKGLTEVNEEKCDLPSITSSLLSSSGPNIPTHTPPPPHLHRIHPVNLHQKRMALQGGPLLGSALTAPKRKRGRPRKLSGSSNIGSEGKEVDERLGETNAEEMCEQKMTESAIQKPEENAIGEKVNAAVNDQIKENHSPAKRVKEEPEPTPGTSSQDHGQSFPNTRPDHDAFPIVKTEADEFDSESLPEDENDLITLSPSSSHSSLTPNEDCLQNFSKDINLSRLKDELESFRRDQFAEEPGRTFSFENTDYVPEDLFESFPHDVFGDEGVTDDKSVRKFCVREADNVYRCVLCSKTYTHISNFCRHYMTTHTNKKQAVPCPLCKKPFTRRDNMLVHIKTVHRYDVNVNKPA